MKLHGFSFPSRATKVDRSQAVNRAKHRICSRNASDCFLNKNTVSSQYEAIDRLTNKNFSNSPHSLRATPIKILLPCFHKAKVKVLFITSSFASKKDSNLVFWNTILTVDSCQLTALYTSDCSPISSHPDAFRDRLIWV